MLKNKEQRREYIKNHFVTLCADNDYSIERCKLNENVYLMRLMTLHKGIEVINIPDYCCDDYYWMVKDGYAGFRSSMNDAITYLTNHKNDRFVENLEVE